MANFNAETRYKSKIKNQAIQTLVDDGKVSNNDGIDFEIFLANTNLAEADKSYLFSFITKIACV